MSDTIKVTTEQVDDIPILLQQGQKIGIAELLTRHFRPHGNWQGTSLGWTSLAWLAYTTSEGDHRLNQVESWVEQRLHTVSLSTGQPVRSREWSTVSIQRGGSGQSLLAKACLALPWITTHGG